MSGQTTGWVLRHGPKDRAMRAVLVTIADAANRDGEHAHPGIPAMVEGSGYSRATVFSALRRLIDEGWLKITEEAKGPGAATVYTVLTERVQKLDSFGDERVQRESNLASERVQSGDSSPYTPTVTSNGNNPLKPPAATPLAIVSAEPGFGDFWTVYPRHESRRTAEKAFERALRRAPAERILDGARRYRDDPNREKQFTKHPSTWLNADGWDDDLLPARTGTRASPPSQSDVVNETLRRLGGNGDGSDPRRNGAHAGLPAGGLPAPDHDPGELDRLRALTR